MGKSPKSIVDHELIHELTKLLDETGLTEIEIEQDGRRVRVARGATATAAPAAVRVEVATAQSAADIAAKPIDPSKHPGVVISPMVGTAYAASEPGAKPFIDVGSTVKAGDTLSKIAKEHLGNANAYMKIFEANRDQLSNPDLIKPGQVLRIP